MSDSRQTRPARRSRLTPVEQLGVDVQVAAQCLEASRWLLGIQPDLRRSRWLA